MKNIKHHSEFLNENQTYDKDKLYRYDVIVKRLSKGPSYIKTEISKLPVIPIKDREGNEIKATKISEFIFNYLFNSKF